jgi:glycosyltransferase involved in cell wall biosynthesis
MQPRLTFAIPFWGRLDYFERALASIKAQTVSDWRALIVDDCSPTAAVRDLVERQNDERITYVRNDVNLGLAGNWSRCLSLSTTPLVTLLHSDDELMPDYAKQLTQAYEQWPDAIAIFCSAHVIDENSKVVFSFRDYIKTWIAPSQREPFIVKGEHGVASILRGNFIMCPTLCYNKAKLGRFHFSRHWGFVLDIDFYMRSLFDGDYLVGLPDILYRYRRHSEQVTAACERDLSFITEQADLWRVTARECRRRGWARAAAIGESARIIRLQIAYYALSNAIRGNVRYAARTLQLLGPMIRTRL